MCSYAVANFFQHFHLRVRERCAFNTVMCLKPGTEVAAAAASLNNCSVQQASMATAAAYATAAQGVRPLMQSTAADALYQLETQRIWWGRITQPELSNTPSSPPAVPTAAQVITCPQVQAIEFIAYAADTPTAQQRCGCMAGDIASAMPKVLPDRYELVYQY